MKVGLAYRLRLTQVNTPLSQHAICPVSQNLWKLPFYS